MAEQPVSYLFQRLNYDEPHPPLYWFLLHGWMRVAGQSELAVRWPSVLAGVITVALAYRLGRALISGAVGLGAALLVAVSPFLIWYSQDARVYALLSTLIMAAVWQTWEAARHNGAWLDRIVTAGWMLAVLFALQNYFFNPAYAKSPNWRGVAAYLDETVRPGEVVVINLPDPAFFHYYRASAPVETSPPAPLAEGGIPATEVQLQHLGDDFDHIRFFFSPSPGYDPDGFVGKWLEACCEKMSNTFVYGFRVQIFDTPAGSLAARAAYPVDLEDGITLIGYRVENAAVRAGETLHWTAHAPVATSYTVFAHFLAVDGFDVVDADSLPAVGRRPVVDEAVIDPHLIPIPADAPMGDYGIEVGLYQLSTGERLAAVASTGARVNAVKLPVTVRVQSP